MKPPDEKKDVLPPPGGVPGLYVLNRQRPVLVFRRVRVGCVLALLRVRVVCVAVLVLAA